MLLAIPFLRSESSFEEVLKLLLLREDLTRRQAARMFGLSESTFNRRFPEAVGLTFQQAKGVLPMAAASHWLLRDRKVSVSEVVFKFRYADLTTFGRRFRELWRMSPTAFRKAFPDPSKAFWIIVRVSHAGEVSLAVGDSPPANGVVLEETGVFVVSMRKSRRQLRAGQLIGLHP